MKLLFNKRKSTFSLFYLLFTLSVFFSSCASSRKLARKQKKVRKVLSTAKSYKGVPYRFGGTTRSGLDCSALIMHSFRAAGYKFPRTTAQQIKFGKKVKAKNLKPGDIVFFGSKKRRRKVVHAGIISENKKGKIKFIHASSSSGVRESNFLSSYWKKVFKAARRIIE